MPQEKTTQEILRNLPRTTSRVKVADPEGNFYWKRIQEVLPSDKIVLSASGYPLIMRGSPGRKNSYGNVTVEELQLDASLTSDYLDIDIAEVADAVPEKQLAPSMSLTKDPLVSAAERNPESPDVINQVMLAFASEAASLAIDRTEAEKRGLDTSGITSRRLTALKSLADTWLKRKNQGASQVIDLEGEAFKALFKYILNTFRDSMIQCGTRNEVIETVFTNFSSKLNDDWMAEAKSLMKNAISE